ncbi:TetR/AcrR family transcriptional regulator [Paenibacillus silviterrae]|uniref:TetR/AcrR family transcriptional regulator n=1 Tax=Paenibacillus silviterrae TaxID=3242194 RepID=UPI0025427B51|nr:TetR/AcrR family transcriptional regulator [Paenibacillus chinjuensis]
MRRRNQIIETAVQLFILNGFENVSIDDINNASGIARGTFYIYFKNKEELLTEILNDTINTVILEIIAMLPQDIPQNIIQYQSEMNMICDYCFDYFKEKVVIINLVVMSRAFGSSDIELAWKRCHDFFLKRYAPALSFIGIPENEIETFLMIRLITLHSAIAYVYNQHPDQVDMYKKSVLDMIKLIRYP